MRDARGVRARRATGASAWGCAGRAARRGPRAWGAPSRATQRGSRLRPGVARGASGAGQDLQ
eukprot:4712280-Pyramimonas_sp.AAC.1